MELISAHRKKTLSEEVNRDDPAPEKRRPMGALEDAVLEVLWDDGGWLVPSQVHAEMSCSHGLRYTTVMTTLTRLESKGRLDRRKDGRAFAYRPTLTRPEWAAACMDEVLNRTHDRTGTLSLFLDRLGDADRTEMRQILSDGGER
jgi:predicted transcriptional regulator